MMEQPSEVVSTGDMPTGSAGVGAVGAAPNGNGHAGPADGATPLEVAELLDALHAMRVGDFSVRLPSHRVGIAGKIADAFNDIVAANERMAQQLEHVGEVVGRE